MPQLRGGSRRRLRFESCSLLQFTLRPGTLALIQIRFVQSFLSAAQEALLVGCAQVGNLFQLESNLGGRARMLSHDAARQPFERCGQVRFGKLGARNSQVSSRNCRATSITFVCCWRRPARSVSVALAATSARPKPTAISCWIAPSWRLDHANGSPRWPGSNDLCHCRAGFAELGWRCGGLDHAAFEDFGQAGL